MNGIDATHDDGREYEYNRRVYVRFDAEAKELVRKAAADAGLSPYIAHFAAEAAKAGKQMVAPGGSRKAGVGVFARFGSPAVKQMVAATARKNHVSLSLYAAHFAVEAAKGGRKMPPTTTCEFKGATCLGGFQRRGNCEKYCDNCKPAAWRKRQAKNRQRIA